MALNVWTRFRNKQVTREYGQSGHRHLLHNSHGHVPSTLGANVVTLTGAGLSRESLEVGRFMAKDPQHPVPNYTMLTR